MSIMGTRVLRKEDPKFLTEGATYTADISHPKLKGAVHAHFVRSTMAHATILEIDTSEAASQPGVLAVYTAQDIPESVAPAPVMVPVFPPSMMHRPHLATGSVRFVGEPVAVVVAETPAQAADAADLVFVDYEPLPAAVGLAQAEADNTVIYEDVGSNTAVDFKNMNMVTGIGEEDIFADCEVVVEHDLINHRTAPAPLEGRSMACVWDDGRLIVWASTQTPHGFRDNLAAVYGLEAENCQVIAPDVGGGFGQKIGITADEIVLPWLSQSLNRPIRWTETRTENLTACGHGRAQLQKVKIGGRQDGQIKAYRLQITGDAGAYTGLGAFLPFYTHLMAPGVYNFPKVETTAKSVVSNTTPTLAYRGAGRPEATAAIERAVDLFAAECGLSPVEVRRMNLISKDSFPYTTPHGTEYDTGDYETALNLALEAADYPALLEEQARRRAQGSVKQLGIGVSVYVEITAAQEQGKKLMHEGQHHANCTYPFGAHVIVVEVDMETGQVTVPQVVTCDDSGTIFNPNIVEGQRHGGIAQGIAQALTEEVVFDEDGNPITSNFADYGFISAAELPSFKLVPLETPTPHNPLGAKGIGESGAIGATPATQSAVVNALSHLGVRHIDIPLTPERVWQAIVDATAQN